MFTLGSKEWPGISKFIEEASEAITVCAKLQATNGNIHYWGNKRLDRELMDELADTLATITFIIDYNSLDEEYIIDRAHNKYDIFAQWHEENIS